MSTPDTRLGAEIGHIIASADGNVDDTYDS